MREEIMRNLSKKNTRLPNQKDKALFLPENQGIYEEIKDLESEEEKVQIDDLQTGRDSDSVNFI